MGLAGLDRIVTTLDLRQQLERAGTRPSDVLIVAHDAGAANQLEAFWRKQLRPAQVFAEGPAGGIFQAPSRPAGQTLATAIERCGLVLTGTSWASDLDARAREFALRERKPSWTVLDNWTDFDRRFSMWPSDAMPTTLITTDPVAAKVASTIFDSTQVIQVESQYVEEQVEAILQLRNSSPQMLSGGLFLDEPLRRHNLDEASELALYRSALGRIVERFGPQLEPLTLRPHPSRSRTPLTKACDELGIDFVIAQEGPLAPELAEASCVFGFETYALWLALRAGIPVYSCLPLHLRKINPLLSSGVIPGLED